MGRHAEHTWFNVIIVLALCFGSITYGYDFSVISTTLGQPGFYAYFGLTASPKDASLYAYSNRIIGAINGLYSAGGTFGALGMAWLCESKGRKTALYVACVFGIVGGALQAGSVHIAMYLVARLITGVAVGAFVTLVPLFQAEIAPPASRGFLVAQHGVVIVTGYSVAAWVGFSCYYSKNLSFQWRFPLSLQVLWPLIMLCLAPWLPESPRWLLVQGRAQEAWSIVATLHQRSDDPEQLFAREEFYQMSRQVEADRSIRESMSLKELWTKPSYRKRMILGAITMFASESTAILVIYNYSVILYAGLGNTGSIPLLLSAAYVTCAAIGNYFCSLMIDRVGRVRLLCIGITGCMVCLIFEAALDAQYTGTTNKAGLGAAVFFLFLHIVFYGSCIDPTTYVYTSEIFPTHIRTYGMGFSGAILFLTTIPYLEAAGTAFATIGWKYYLVFITISAVMIPLIFFYFPETKGLSLEEINEVFGDSVVVHLTHISDEEKAELDAKIKAGEDPILAAKSARADEVESAVEMHEK